MSKLTSREELIAFFNYYLKKMQCNVFIKSGWDLFAAVPAV